MVRLAIVSVVAVVLGIGAFPSAARAAAALKNPAALKEQAPATFRAAFDTSAGLFVVEVRRAWAPNGADRFYNLVKNGFYDDARFFRVIRGFMVQFGIHADPAVSAVWRNARIPVDPVKETNRRGTITYAMAGSPDTRTTQVFINFQNNASLDKQGFAPFGEVVTGMDVVDKLYGDYGEGAPSGKGPSRAGSRRKETRTSIKSFPNLSYIKKATIETK